MSKTEENTSRISSWTKIPPSDDLAARVVNPFSTALCPKASLAGRSHHEAQGKRSRWGEVPRSGTGHPPVPPVDFAPSLNWPGSNASEKFSVFLPLIKVAHKILQPVE